MKEEKMTDGTEKCMQTEGEAEEHISTVMLSASHKHSHIVCIICGVHV